MIIVDGQGLFDLSQKEPVEAFTVLNIQSRQSLTSYAQVSCKCTVATCNLHKKPLAVFEVLFGNEAFSTRNHRAVH